MRLHFSHAVGDIGWLSNSHCPIQPLAMGKNTDITILPSLAVYFYYKSARSLDNRKCFLRFCHRISFAAECLLTIYVFVSAFS